MFSNVLRDRGDSVVVSIGDGIEVGDRERRLANFYLYSSGWCLPFLTDIVGEVYPERIVGADKWVPRNMTNSSLYMPNISGVEYSVSLYKKKRYVIRSIVDKLLVDNDYRKITVNKWKSPPSLECQKVGDSKQMGSIGKSNWWYFYNKDGKEIDSRVDTFYLEVGDEAISVYEDKAFSDCIDLWFYD